MGLIILNGEQYGSFEETGFPPLIYSDEEREVGVWIDGKPLYQKSYIYENSSGSAGDSSGATFDVWNLGNDKVIISGGLQCTFVNLTTNKMYPLPYADSSFTNVFMDNGIVKLKVRNDDWGSNYKLYMTARYTKTTDVAGSGKYTTYGGLAHHYSTSEQVVGTWIDGKPLYEKTISKTVNCDSEYDMITRDDSISGLPSTAVPRFVTGGYFDGGVPLSHYDSSNYRTFTMWYSNNIRGYVKWGTLSTTTLRVTIQYTKTTD